MDIRVYTVIKNDKDEQIAYDASIGGVRNKYKRDEFIKFCLRPSVRRENFSVVSGKYIRGKDCPLPVETLPALPAVHNRDFGFNYTIMSMGTGLANVFITDGHIVGDVEFLCRELLPIGVTTDAALKDWFEGRRVPASRQHLDDLHAVLGSSAAALLEKSYAASLSDSFWIKPKGSKLAWADVNFFKNEFTDDIGEFLIRGDGALGSLVTPSNTTDGVYPKKWIIKSGVRYLVKKGGREAWQCDHLNEVFAYKVGKFLGFNVAPYFAFGKDLCATPCFIKPGENLVSAYNYLRSVGKAPKDGHADSSLFAPLAVPFGREWLEQMLLLDYIVMNKDRHTKNFGFIQNASTGKLIAPAPIFDSGNSMFYNIDFSRERPFVNVPAYSRPFCSVHSEQVGFVSVGNYADKLRALCAKLYDMVCDGYEKSGLLEEHVDGIAELAVRRVKALL